MVTPTSGIPAARGPQALEVLSGYGDEELAALDRLSTRAVMPAGTVVCKKGAPGREAYLVLDGEAGITDGERDIGVVGPGSIIGEMALLDLGPRTATVVARTPLLVLVFNAPEFGRVLREVPSLAPSMSAALAARLRHAEGGGADPAG